MPNSPDLVESQSFNYFYGLHPGHINFVGQNKDGTVFELLVGDDTVESVFGHFEPISVAGVQDVNDGLRVVIVVMPEVPQLGLSSNVPDCELETLVIDFLDIKANSGN